MVNSGATISSTKTSTVSSLADGEHIVKNVIPAHIDELNTILGEGGALDWRKRDSVVTVVLPRPVMHTEKIPLVVGCRQDRTEVEHEMGPGAIVVRYEGGIVPPNQHIARLEQAISPIVLKTAQTLNELKNWVRLRVPRVEDGNNFGVEVQELGLTTVDGAESSVCGMLAMLTSTAYELTRIDMIRNSSKYPDLGDYQQIMAKRDTAQFDKFRQMSVELRDILIEVHSTVVKNLGKIKNPRTGNLYGSMYGNYSGDEMVE